MIAKVKEAYQTYIRRNPTNQFSFEEEYWGESPTTQRIKTLHKTLPHAIQSLPLAQLLAIHLNPERKIDDPRHVKRILRAFRKESERVIEGQDTIVEIRAAMKNEARWRKPPSVLFMDRLVTSTMNLHRDNYQLSLSESFDHLIPTNYIENDFVYDLGKSRYAILEITAHATQQYDDRPAPLPTFDMRSNHFLRQIAQDSQRQFRMEKRYKTFESNDRVYRYATLSVVEVRRNGRLRILGSRPYSLVSELDPTSFKSKIDQQYPILIAP